MQPDSLVIIRTFRDLLAADEAQVALMSAGVYALIFSDDSRAMAGIPGEPEIALAVHRRDVDLAETALATQPIPL